MAESRTLKVGDRIYCKHYNKIMYVSTVVRLTKTQAITDKDARFRLDVSDNGYVRDIGRDTWSVYSYYLESEDLKKALKRQIAINKIKEVDFGKLTDEKLQAILSIVNNP